MRINITLSQNSSSFSQTSSFTIIDFCVFIASAYSRHNGRDTFNAYTPFFEHGVYGKQWDFGHFPMTWLWSGALENWKSAHDEISITTFLSTRMILCPCSTEWTASESRFGLDTWSGVGRCLSSANGADGMEGLKSSVHGARKTDSRGAFEDLKIKRHSQEAVWRKGSREISDKINESLYDCQCRITWMRL